MAINGGGKLPFKNHRSRAGVDPKESFAVFFLTFQRALTFKKPGYSLANGVDEYGKILLKPAFGVLEGCFSMFVFRVNSVKKQHVGRF